jgi:hypothetical protein
MSKEFNLPKKFREKQGRKQEECPFLPDRLL